jgi:2-polyprenyl-3-methyl-5-hydroxy-6-metoxy-1,4-benzoquinol methylase
MDKARTYTFRPVAACDMCLSKDFGLLGFRLNQQQGKNPKAVPGVAVSVKQCRNCTLIFADPQPVPHSIEDHYGMPPEEYWTHQPFEWTPDYYRHEIAAAKRLLPFQKGMRALDVGVGQGKGMHSLVHAGFEAWGIEPSKAFYDRATQTFDASRIQNKTMEEADFPAGYFDFVMFSAVLEHLFSPSESLRRAVSWIKPGGIIQAEVPASNYLITKLLNRFFALRGTNYVGHISPMHPPFHLYEFGLKSFEENARINGYEVAEFRLKVADTPIIPRPIRPFLDWWMRRSESGMQLHVYLRKPAV